MTAPVPLEMKRLIKRRISQIKSDCKVGRRNAKFTFTIEQGLKKYIDQRGLCALTGWTMETSGGTYYKNKNPKSLSFDRMDPQKDYTDDNIMFVCTLVNNMRSDMPLHKFKKMCKSIGESNAGY